MRRVRTRWNGIIPPVRRPMCIVCLIVVALIYIASNGKPPGPGWDVDACSGKTIVVSGVISERQIKNGNLQIYIKNPRFTEDVKGIFPDSADGVVAYISDMDCVPDYVRMGCEISVKGVFYPFEVPMNEGQFDSRRYYAIRRYDGQLRRARIIGVSYRYNLLLERIRRYRDDIVRLYCKYMDEEDAGVLAAMTLGDKSILDSDIKTQYQNAGIAHVLAMSGLHIASVGLLILRILRKLKLNVVWSSAVSGILISIYAVMSGMSTSTIRALIMFILAAIALCLGRTYDLLTAAAVAAVCILFENAGYIYDGGFQLSFGSVVALGLVYPVVDKYLTAVIHGMGNQYITTVNKPAVARNKNKYARGNRYKNVCKVIADIANNVFKSLGAGVTITLVTLPITLGNFYQISIKSLLLNLLVIPLMTIILCGGMVGVIFGGFYKKIIGARRVLNVILKIDFKITSAIIKLYNAVTSENTGFLDSPLVLGKPDGLKCVLYVVLLGVSMVMMSKAVSHHAVDQSSRSSASNNAWNVIKNENKITPLKQMLFRARIIRECPLFTGVCALLTIIIACVILVFRHFDEFEIRNLYVGQGDCAIITGRHVPTIMIDGGSSDIKSVGEYRILPALKANGIRNVDYCFISHMDSDHMNGIMEILNKNNGVRIRNIVLSESYVRTQNRLDENSMDESYKLLTNYEKEGKVVLSKIKSDDVFDIGNMQVRCMSPDKLNEYEGNDSSIVLLISYYNSAKNKNDERNIYKEEKFNALFTGDISSEVERTLCEYLENVTYLKVAHHGSKYSSSEAFLLKSNPQISIISSGIDNSYGHPHKETLERIQEYAPNSRLYRTDECGQITTFVGGNGVIIRGFISGH